MEFRHAAERVQFPSKLSIYNCAKRPTLFNATASPTEGGSLAYFKNFAKRARSASAVFASGATTSTVSSPAMVPVTSGQSA